MSKEETQCNSFQKELANLKNKVEILETKQEVMRLEKIELIKLYEKSSSELELQQEINRQINIQLQILQGQLQERTSKSFENIQNFQSDYQNILSEVEGIQGKSITDNSNKEVALSQEINKNEKENKEDDLEEKVRGRSIIQVEDVPASKTVKFGEEKQGNDRNNIDPLIPVRDQNSRKSFYKPVDRDLKRRMEEITLTSEGFFSDNGIQFDIQDSPFYKVSVARVEKRAENTRTFLKKFGKTLKELVKSGETFSSTLQSLSKEINLNLSLVEDNKELFSMFSYTSEYFKDLTTFFDALHFNLTSKVIEPLKIYCLKNLDVLKELKKKTAKAQEEYEAIDFKNSQMKKSSILKDKNHYNQLLKNHQQSYTQFEISRFELTEHINKIQFEMNTQISNGICSVLQSFATFNEQQRLESRQLESYLRLFQAPQNLKSEYFNEMSSKLQQMKQKINNNEKASEMNTSKKRSKVKGEYLHIKSHKIKDFKRRYFQIERGNFYSIKVKKNMINRQPLSTLALLNFNESPECEFINSFELISPQMPKPLLLIAPSQQSLQDWKKAIKEGTESYLAKGIGSSSLECLSSMFVREREESNQDELIYEIIEKNDCSDCGKSEPSWISLNLCVIICLECSGIHRKLGPSISKVRSLKLDNIHDDILEFYLKNGTKEINEMWEKKKESNQIKPTFESNSDQKEAYIKDKYINLKFMIKDTSSNFVELMCKAIQSEKLIDIVQTVVSRGISLERIYQIQQVSQTFLHYSAAKASLKVVSFLIQIGADINALDTLQRRPIDIAKIEDKKKERNKQNNTKGYIDNSLLSGLIILFMKDIDAIILDKYQTINSNNLHVVDQRKATPATKVFIKKLLKKVPNITRIVQARTIGNMQYPSKERHYKK